VIENTSAFQNILVINHGQLGDVIMSLPALRAIRVAFPNAKLTLFCGKATAEIIDIAGFADEKIVVDRVLLRDSGKFWSIWQIFKIVADVRKRHFDFVIDLHSLPETNIVGFLSGAKKRLFANRENRSFDFLSNFRPKPLKENRLRKLDERYFDTLQPLGIEKPSHFIEIPPPAEEIAKTKILLETLGFEDKTLIGLFLGAGHESRRWNLLKFAELAEKLSKIEKVQVLVFLGPEEQDIFADVKAKFPSNVAILDDLNLRELFSISSFLKVLVSNDTGPMHLAAVAGAEIVLIIDKNGSLEYSPLTENLTIVNTQTINEISVAEVYLAVLERIENA
jgi:ADP-heptose:LPS heptosyltransferase